MKLIFATDLHGDTAAYAALADLARAEQATAVLLGGDLCEYSRTAAPQLTFAAGPLREFLDELRAARIGVVAIWGNDDRAALAGQLQDFAREGLLTLAGTTPQWISALDDPRERVAVIGYPYVPPTPFRIKEQERRDLAADRYQGRLPILVSAATPDDAPVEAPDDYLDRLPSIEDDLAAIPPLAPPWIAIVHTPPWQVLDLTSRDVRAGSRAVRTWLLARQPVLALHGHIHEAPDCLGRWAERLGATLCVNPGAALGTAVQAVVIELTGATWRLRHTLRGPLDE
ncbi:MAG: metallophosphoesterase family protein [Thermomicrobiales bacterium]